jgi:antitoxin component of RelBE/YafQ-DinJ toxin-antitoxin module
MAKVQLCARIDNDVYSVLKAIEEEFGIPISTVVRLALSWFAPRLFLALKRLELEELLSLEKRLEDILKDGLRGGYHT